MNPVRPALRYFGGKWLLAPWIISHLPEHRIYIEPFGGAASVLLRKNRSYSEVYNDMDKEVVDFFRVLRDPCLAQQLADKLHLTPFGRAEFDMAHEPTNDQIERARRLVVRSFQGFGSDGIAHDVNGKTGFRSSSNRSGGVPAHDWMSFPANIEYLSERLRGVTIECAPAIDVMARNDAPDALHYVDPPYHHDTRKAGHCYRHEMTAEQHMELLTFLRSLKGCVVLSGYPHANYCHTLEGWRKFERQALADGARKRVECLWLNPQAQEAQTQQDIFETHSINIRGC